MKILEKTALVLFSTIILILSIITCLLIFGWLKVDVVNLVIKNTVSGEITANVTLVVCVAFILLAIKCIFFDSSSKSKTDIKEGILLENNDGKLLISKETLENLVSGIAKGFEGAQNITTKVYLDKENNLKVYVTLFVNPNAVIKDLSSNLQAKIKEAIKKAADLDVKEVNINVKNIAAPAKETIGE